VPGEHAAIAAALRTAGVGSDLAGFEDQAAAIPVLVLEHAKGEFVELGLVHGDAEHAAIKRGRAIEVGHGNIEPDRAIVGGIEVAHDSLQGSITESTNGLPSGCAERRVFETLAAN